MHGRTLFASVVLTLGLALAGAPPAPARRAGQSLRILLPARGHVTLETLSVTVKGAHGRSLPRKLRFAPRGLAQLPPSVRIVVARRTIHGRKSTRYVALLLVINVADRKTSRAVPRQAPGDEQLLGGETPTRLDQLATYLLFMGAPNLAIEEQREQDAKDSKLIRDAYYSTHARADRNADLGAAGDGPYQAELASMLGSSKTEPLDPSVDTGHYDDGHAFGWGVNTKREEAQLMRDAFEASVQDLIDTIEHDLGADVNGDGTVSEGVQTTVGPVSCSPSPC